MNNLNLKRIQTFLFLAEYGSFRRAAELLNRSPSAVSAHIQQLEEDVGVQLVNRTTRRVSLTAEGKMLLVRGRSTLAELDAVINELREQDLIRRGFVSVGSSPSVSAHCLPPIIAEFQKEHPGVTFRLQEDFAEDMYDRLREEEIDFAVGPRLNHLNGFDFYDILSDPLVAVLPLDFPLEGRKELELREIACYPYLAMPKATAIRRVLENASFAQGISLLPRLEVIHQQTLFSMVTAGLGITILPRISVPKEGGAYKVVGLSSPSISRKVSLITLRGRTLSPSAQCCANLIRSRLEQLDCSRS